MNVAQDRLVEGRTFSSLPILRRLFARPWRCHLVSKFVLFLEAHRNRVDQMRIRNSSNGFSPDAVLYNRCTIDLPTGEIRLQEIPCRNLEDVLGGFGRSFQLLAERDVSDAFAPENPLIVNTGLLTGSNVMTGLRTYFSAYSPLKISNKGLPAAIWSAGSGKFGCKMKWAGLDELIVEGKSSQPLLVVITEGRNGPRVELKPADGLLGLDTHEKIMALQRQHADAHFAVIGPAGEHYDSCYFAAVAMSTENQLKLGDDKCRWAGRGGMGAVMGSKKVIGIVAQSKDKATKVQPAIRDLNREISTGPGSRKFREKNKGGLGGTWSNYQPLEKFYVVPQNNFRPKGDDKVKLLFRDQVEDEFVITAESCFRCGIHCHKNVYEKRSDGSKGAFRAKFDYEPLNLLSTNLGIHDPHQAWHLVRLVDSLGMDSISCGTTIAYVLDYNERHPDKPLLNGATFGDFDKVRRLIEETGTGRLPDVGRGLKRLSERLGETSYAMHAKGLELPAYIPDTNPGYPWAIAGGHMSMGTFMSVVLEGNTSLDFWVNAITQRGLYQVKDDLIGVCKFAGLTPEKEAQALQAEFGLRISQDDLLAAVRRAFLRGLALERKQGYDDSDYTLPSQVFDNPNPEIQTPRFVTREFFAELHTRVWEVFNREIQAL